MSVIYVLLSVSLLMATIFLMVFIYHLKNGQFEDDHTPSIRILFDDKKTKK